MARKSRRYYGDSHSGRTAGVLGHLDDIGRKPGRLNVAIVTGFAESGPTTRRGMEGVWKAIFPDVASLKAKP